MDIQTLEDERRRAIQAQGDLRMGVSGGWNVAGKNMRSSPYADFEPFDDGYDDPEDYRGKPVFGVEEDGQTFFDFPFVQAPNDMMIANFLAPSGTGKTLSDEWYEKGIDTIMETTEPGSYTRDERMRILNHQYLDQVKKPQSGLMISHHTGGKHFTEPSMEELIDGLINGEIPRGTLGDEETENRLIQERQNQLQQQSLMIRNNVANLPYQDGRAPTRLFYNAPYAKPDIFIKDKQIIEDAKKRFKWNTGINLAKR